GQEGMGGQVNEGRSRWWPPALVSCPPALRSLHRGVRRDRRVDAVEQPLERAVRLAAEGDLGGKEIERALADPRLGGGDGAVPVALAPRPAAAERRGVGEPRERPDSLR